MKKALLILTLFISGVMVKAQDIYLETENFPVKGGWCVDQQFTEKMGSPYLIAHGLGKPVESAEARFTISRPGEYHLYARTYNWTSPWSDQKGPGAFRVRLNGESLPEELGCHGTDWEWEYAGSIWLDRGEQSISLEDLSGFDGRCDALYLTREKGKIPPEEVEQLKRFREKLCRPEKELVRKDYDLVVVGAGVAGISAAVSAARLGCTVALINDRPIVGGNNSSDIRVHLGGRIELDPYPKLGDLQKEFGPSKLGNAQPAANYEDDKKMKILEAEPNIDLYLNYKVTEVQTRKNQIKAIQARHIESGKILNVHGKVYSDCTGDGTVGYLAGADYMYGRECKADFGEQSAPDERDSLVMGSSVQWYSKETGAPAAFPLFEYGLTFNMENCEMISRGDWDWETGMRLDQIRDAEKIRDYGLLVVYSNWSFLKNQAAEETRLKFAEKELEWVAYVAGKRESRRLVGDYVLRESDLKNRTLYEDATASTSWTIDLHYPLDKHVKDFPGKEFRSKAVHMVIYPYPIPYRCLYSKDIKNLFMAGRDISVTHIALGTSRVMRTTGMMGEVVGMAASLCKTHDVQPRDIYLHHLDELKGLMEKGVGKAGFKNNQKYNQGSSAAFPRR